jgi:hypothetical protein
MMFGSVVLNDSIPTDAAITALTQPASGTLVFAPDGSFNFTPAASFSGTLTFDYQVCHPAPNTSVCSVQTATLTFTAASFSSPPTASPPAGATTSSQVIERAAVDTAPTLPATAPPAQSGIASACLETSSGCAASAVVEQVGKFELSGQGAVQFTPAADFVGDTSITRRSTTDAGVVVLDVVRFEVNPPIRTLATEIETNQIAKFATENQGMLWCLVLQATAPCQNTLELSGVGTWRMQPSGLVEFEPVKNFVGTHVVWLRSTSASTSSFTKLSVSVVKPKSEAATKRPPVKLVLTNFADGSPILTKSFMTQIRAFMNRYSDYATIRCFGQTEGPTVLRGDRALATARANNACGYALSLRIGEFVRLANKTANRLIESATLRRVVIYLTD